MVRRRERSQVIVTEDVMYPKDWIYNKNGNNVRKDRLLKKGVYDSVKIYRYSTRYDYENAHVIIVGDLVFHIGEHLIGNASQIRISEISVRYL